MNRDEVKEIAREVFQEDAPPMIKHGITMHEIRFTLSGGVIGVCGLLGYLASQGLL